MLNQYLYVQIGFYLNQTIEKEHKLNSSMSQYNKSQRMTERQMQAQGIKQSLLKIQSRYKSSTGLKKAQPIPIIQISSSSYYHQSHGHSSVNAEEDYEQQPQEKQKSYDKGEQKKQSKFAFSSSARDQSDWDQSEVNSESLHEPIIKEGRKVQVVDVSLQTHLPYEEPKPVILQIRDENGQELIDIYQYNEIRTYTRQYAEQHYLFPLIEFYQKHITFDFAAYNGILNQ